MRPLYAALTALMLLGACAVQELKSTCTAAPSTSAANPCTFTEIKEAKS